uniref:Major facilitator superfamily (MFS) profile domain-containing protein n=1 Tax=Ciona savignyi TaxID=51511 RepID=H2YK14_CIOSA
FQGVIEFSLCLLFAKLVSYTFLFWLPFYLKSTSKYESFPSFLRIYIFLGYPRSAKAQMLMLTPPPSLGSLNATMAGLMSTLFDIGGIFGGITAGLLSDHSGACATTCSLMLLVGAGMVG